MNIYTYFEPLMGGQQGQDAITLMRLWKKNWFLNGWNPVVLTQRDAMSHPRYTLFLDAIAKLPTVNGHAYEDACYLRWMALSVHGGGWMTDNDVMAYGVKHMAPPEKFLVCSRNVPCAAGGTRAAIDKFLTLIENYKLDGNDVSDGRPHCSDMMITTRYTADGTLGTCNTCVEFGSPGWEKAAMVHYASGAMGPRGFLPKWKHIPVLRPGRFV